MIASTKVLVTSCETAPDAWRHQEEILRAHFPPHDPALALTEDPDEADVIFIGNLREENNYEKLRRHPLVKRFPQKTYVITDGDEYPRFCQGIVTSLTRSLWNCGRFRSGAYFLFHPDFKNPFVEQWFAERAKRGGREAPPKEYLACFSGRNCLPLRTRLLALRWERPDVFIRDTTHCFDNFTHQPMGKGPEQKAYFNLAVRSKFMLCPRGNGAASIRFFEAMQLGIVPVLISDNWMLPEGPDWEKCTLRIREDALDQLEATLVAHESAAAAMGREAQRAYEKYFHGESYLRYLVGAAQSIQRRRGRPPERWCQAAWLPAVLAQKLVRRVQQRLRRPRRLPHSTDLPAPALEQGLPRG